MKLFSTDAASMTVSISGTVNYLLIVPRHRETHTDEPIIVRNKSTEE